MAITNKMSEFQNNKILLNGTIFKCARKDTIFNFIKFMATKTVLQFFNFFCDDKKYILLSFMIVTNTVHFIFDFILTLLWMNSYIFVGCTKH